MITQLMLLDQIMKDKIPKWKYEEVKERYDVDRDLEVKVMVNGHRYNVSEWFK